MRRWIAAAIGFLGTLVILRPGGGVFELAALIPLMSALGFAVFNVLTRRISRDDSFATNMLYMGFSAQWPSPYPAFPDGLFRARCSGS